jgi:hypothetical protein
MRFAFQELPGLLFDDGHPAGRRHARCAARQASQTSGRSLPRSGTARPVARAHARTSAVEGSGASSARASSVVAAAAANGASRPAEAAAWPNAGALIVTNPAADPAAGLSLDRGAGWLASSALGYSSVVAARSATRGPGCSALSADLRGQRFTSSAMKQVWLKCSQKRRWLATPALMFGMPMFRMMRRAMAARGRQVLVVDL